MNPSFIKINLCTGKTRNKYSVSNIKYIEGTNPTFEFDRDEPKDASSSDSSETRKSKHRNNAKTKEKILRNRGQAYYSFRSNKVCPSRSIKPAWDCKLKCLERINNAKRLELFNSYWKLGNVDLHRAYIRSCMEEVQPKYRYMQARQRRLNRAFYFTVDDQKVRVCRRFFMATLDISTKVVRTAILKSDSTGFVETDLRGKYKKKQGSRENINPTI